MKQKHTLQWLSAVTGRAKGLVGLLVVVQTVLSVSSIAFAFVLRRIPVHFFIDQFRKGLAAHLPALTLIRLCNAPAQSILVIFIAATHNNTLQIVIEHDVYINHILQTCNAGCVECDTILANHDCRITKMCKQLLSHNLI